jgi:hypothetical protein
MRTILVSLRLVIAVGGCETPPTPVSGKEQMTVLDAGDAAVTALGTPSSPLRA